MAAEREQKLARMKTANLIIEAIASHGRKFFSLHAEGRTEGPNRISRFEFRNGRLWFIDKYTEKAIYTAYRRGNWPNFSEGGTLRDLICSLSDWINGKESCVQLWRFGPWPEWVCGGDLWGYGEHMEAVRVKVNEILAASEAGQ